MNSAALWVGITALFAFAGCGKAPMSQTKTDNPEISVELLFENDGIKVYRFRDYGREIYYTDARGRTDWTTQHSTGKTTYTKHHGVETVGE